MAYAGTVVTYGRGQAIVVATGMATEFGQISRLVQTVEAGRTPLQENLDTLGRTLGKAALVVVALIVALGLWRGLPLLDMLIFGIALAVAVVPEALPAVVTISLAIGVRRMVKRNALVRRLPVVETLGSTSVICSDKTGTLTKNEMTVRQLFAAGQLISVSGAGYEPVGEFRDGERTFVPDLAALELLRAGVLASDARLRQAARAVAHRRRPHRRRIGRGGGQGGTRSGTPGSTVPPHRRDSLQLGTPAHDDAAHGRPAVRSHIRRARPTSSSKGARAG